MAHEEYEIIAHSKIQHVNIFLVSLAYRNPHIHSELEVCAVLQGEAAVFLNGETHTAGKGDIVLLNPDQPHEIRSVGDQNTLILAIQLSPKFFANYSPSGYNIEFEELFAARGDDPSQKLFEMLLQMARAYFTGGIGYEFQCVGLVNLMLAQFWQNLPYRFIGEKERAEKDLRTRRLSRITQYINEHYTEKLLLSDIAALEGLSMSYLSHFFRDNLNITFQEYLNNIRFEKALQLMERTKKKLIDISMESGFSDSKYLNRMFFERFHCSPREYHKNLRNAREGRASLDCIQTFYTEEESLAFLSGFQNT